MADDKKHLDAKCRLLAAELGALGYTEGHDVLLRVASSMDAREGSNRYAQFPGAMMGGPLALDPYQTMELADVGSEDNPRPTEEDILNKTPEPGSRLDPERGVPTESDVRKWTVQISDIPAPDENAIKEIVQPFVEEVGGLLSDYKEEKPRTRSK